MEENDPKIIRDATEIAVRCSGGNQAELSDEVPPVRAPEKKKWSSLPPITFTQSEDPWRKINDQTIPLADDKIPCGTDFPSDIFLG
jgi:hypothetical protein